MGLFSGLLRTLDPIGSFVSDTVGGVLDPIGNALFGSDGNGAVDQVTVQQTPEEIESERLAARTPEQVWQEDMDTYRSDLKDSARTTNAEQEAQRNNPQFNYGDSFDMQKAQAGVLGPEAQRQAMAQYSESPGVQWQREQGMRSLENDAAITGKGGGSRLKAISQFNQGLAQQDFNNQFNRLGSITGVNVNAANTTAGLVTNTAVGQANVQQSIGNAQAGASLARGQAIGSAMNSISSAAGAYGGGMST